MAADAKIKNENDPITRNSGMPICFRKTALMKSVDETTMTAIVNEDMTGIKNSRKEQPVIFIAECHAIGEGINTLKNKADTAPEMPL